MGLTLILTALTILSAIHILQVKHLMGLSSQAATFLNQAHQTFLQVPEYSPEAQNATADMLTLRDYHTSIAMYSMITLIIFPLNVIGVVSVGAQDLTSLYMALAICDSLIMVNAYRMWQKMLQINAVCLGYNIALQSIQYIKIEPGENQKDG